MNEEIFTAFLFTSNITFTNKNYKELIKEVQEYIINNNLSWEAIKIEDSNKNTVESIGYRKNTNPSWFFANNTNIQ